MYAATLLGFLALFSTSTQATVSNLGSRNFETHDYFTLHLRSDADPYNTARYLGLRYEGTVGELEDFHYFSAPKGQHDAQNLLDTARDRRRKRETDAEDPLAGIKWSQKQALKKRLEKRSAIPPKPEWMDGRQDVALPDDDVLDPEEHAEAQQRRDWIMKTLEIKDPIFDEQWHLFNSIELGHDVNVTGLWLEGVTGRNATVAVIDDGLDMYSNDLKANYFAAGSYDFNDHTDEPRPRLADDRHGTRCAGEIAAARNNVCGVGVAYDSKVAGIRILSKPISDEDESAAINYNMQNNHIYSCSWGPPDNGRAMDAPNTMIKSAILNGVQKGRNGLGSVFVFAAGNGAASDDNCNFDGYTNSIYSITVGAIDRKGLHPHYSEKCSASMVVTYSSGSGDAIHTTDVGTDTCYAQMGGTSAAAPLAAGILALVMGVRPDLHWRDFQYLCMNTAVPVNTHEVDEWQTTYIGKKYSHTYAYGKLDAYALVEAAKTWKSVKAQAWLKSPWQHVRKLIPEGTTGLASSFQVTGDMLKKANVERLEHVTVTMNVEHTRRGDLSVDLISPAGIVSHLSTARRMDEHKSGYRDWTFMSVVHWGEPGIGNWTVIIKDNLVNGRQGTFTDWRITLWGEAIDGTNQPLHPMPTEHEDDDHDREDADVTTTSVSITSSSALPTALPEDHPHRPVNDKPESAPVSPTPTPSVSETTNHDASETTLVGTNTPSASSTPFYLPSIFPTFGVSPKTQVWIYATITVILIFIVGLLSIFLLWRARRNRLARGERAEYEFELVDEDDVDGIASGDEAEQAEKKRRRKVRRGGELYDAFAGGSDDEETLREGKEDKDVFSEDEEEGSASGSGSAGSVGRYRDEKR